MFDEMIPYEYCLDESLKDFVLEAPGVTPKEGEVWITDFPFMMGGAMKDRRAIYLNDPDFGIIAIRVSTLKRPTPKDRAKRRKTIWINKVEYVDPEYRRNYNKIIQNPFTQGFTANVYFLANNALQLRHVNPLGHKPTGYLDKKTLAIVKSKFALFKQNRHTKMFELMSWLLLTSIDQSTHPSGNNNNNPMQSLSDLETSRQGNCMDTTTAFHTVATKYSIPHKIVNVVFSDGANSNPSHWFVVFSLNGLWRYVHYICGDPAEGEISQNTYSSADSAIKAYTTNVLHPHFGLHRKPVTKILTPSEMKIWDDAVKAKTIQKNLIEALNKKDLDEKVEEMLWLGMF